MTSADSREAPRPFLIRAEAPGDAPAIDGLIRRAFADDPHGSHNEERIVRALRAAGALSVSLVAGQGDAIIGHVAFSPVAVGSGAQRWYGLGPLAVEPAFQQRGIGSALVEAGLAELEALAAAGCVVLGEPGYYGRFGFRVVEGLVYPGPPPEYFLGKVLDGVPPTGVVEYHDAFSIEP